MILTTIGLYNHQRRKYFYREIFINIWNLIPKIFLFHPHQFTKNVRPCGRSASSNRKYSSKTINSLICSITSTTAVGHITWVFVNLPNMVKKIQMLLNNQALGLHELNHPGLSLFLSLIWSGLQCPKAYSLWGGVVPSPSIG